MNKNLLPAKNIQKIREKNVNIVFFDFSEEEYKNFSIQQLVEKIINMSRNDAEGLQKIDFQQQLKEFRALTSNIDSIRKDEILRIQNYLSKNQEFLKNADNVPSFGYIDLQKIDFTLSPQALNNYVFDIAFFWVALINYPEFQSNLTAEFLKKSSTNKDFDHLFKLDLALIIPYFLKKTEGIESLKKERESLINEWKIIRYSDMEVAEKRNNILKKFNLRKKIFFKNARLNRTPVYITLLCEDDNKNEYVLKMMHGNCDKTKNRFINEIEMAKFLEHANICPNHVASNLNSSPEWFIYKFIDGKRTGNYYRIYKNFLTERTIKQVLQNLMKIREMNSQIPYKLKNKIDIQLKEKINYMRQVSSKVLLKKTLFAKEEVEKKVNYFVKNIKKADLSISHNDLHPENVIINENSIYFLDFNLSEMNTLFFDFATFFLCGWQDKSWIKKAVFQLVKYFPELKDAQTSIRKTFDLSLIEASLKLTVHAEFPDVKHTKNKSEEIEFSKKACQYFSEVFQNLGDMFL